MDNLITTEKTVYLIIIVFLSSFCEALFNTENALNSHIESDHGTGPDPPKESIIFNNFAQPLPVQDHGRFMASMNTTKNLYHVYLNQKFQKIGGN